MLDAMLRDRDDGGIFAADELRLYADLAMYLLGGLDTTVRAGGEGASGLLRMAGVGETVECTDSWRPLLGHGASGCAGADDSLQARLALNYSLLLPIPVHVWQWTSSSLTPLTGTQSSICHLRSQLQP